MTLPQTIEYLTILETVEQAIEESREAAECYSILYISLEPNDYILLQDELEAISGRKAARIETLHSYPVYIELAPSHLEMFDSERIIRRKTLERQNR